MSVSEGIAATLVLAASALDGKDRRASLVTAGVVAGVGIATVIGYHVWQKREHRRLEKSSQNPFQQV